jgi:hypothetical protein
LNTRGWELIDPQTKVKVRETRFKNGNLAMARFKSVVFAVPQCDSWSSSGDTAQNMTGTHLCPNLGAAQPDPSNKKDYDVFIRFSSSYKLSIHVNTSLQLFRPLEKNLN